MVRQTENKANNYCFTVNNYTDDHLLTLANLECRYICYGKEVGESGTPHLQGFVSFKNRVAFGSVKKKLPAGAHIEKKSSKSTFLEASDYCKKDGDYIERGDLPADKKRKAELTADYYRNIKKLAQAGDLESIDSEIYIKHYSTLCRIKKDHAVLPPNADDVTGIWYYGEAGVGKSRAARHDYPNSYMKMANKWWDGYRDEEFVIIDDLDPRHKVLGHHLKIWADRYGFMAENKGGAIAIRPKKIIVTSQYSPDRIWDDEPETVAAIRRRFKVVHFDKRWCPPPAEEEGAALAPLPALDFPPMDETDINEIIEELQYTESF